LRGRQSGEDCVFDSSGRSNLKISKELNLLIKVIPFRVHIVDKDFFLFPASSFLRRCWYAVKPGIVYQQPKLFHHQLLAGMAEISAPHINNGV